MTFDTYPLMKEPTSRELEIEQVRMAIARTAAEIVRLEGVLDRMRNRQIARRREIARQMTIEEILPSTYRG